MRFSSTKGKRKLATSSRAEVLTADLAGRYAEMDKAAKNKISHRGIALQRLRAWFEVHSDDQQLESTDGQGS